MCEKMKENYIAQEISGKKYRKKEIHMRKMKEIIYKTDERRKKIEI